MRLILAHNTVSSGLILNTVSTGVLITQNFYEIYPNSVSKELIFTHSFYGTDPDTNRNRQKLVIMTKSL